MDNFILVGKENKCLKNFDNNFYKYEIEKYNLYVKKETSYITLNIDSFCIFIFGYMYNPRCDLLTEENKHIYLNDFFMSFEKNNFSSFDFYDGYFVILLFNKQNKRLFFFNDPIGNYPLFYSEYLCSITNNVHNFFLLGVRLSIDKNELIRSVFYKTFVGNQERTLYKEINKCQFYSIYYIYDEFFFCNVFYEKYFSVSIKYEDAVEKCKQTYFDSIKYLCKNFSNPVFDCSGGLDSTSNVAVALAVTNKRINTWKGIYSYLEPTAALYESDKPIDNYRINYNYIYIDDCLMLDDLSIYNKYNYAFPNVSVLYSSFLNKQKEFFYQNKFDCAITGFYSENIFNSTEPTFIFDLAKQRNRYTFFKYVLDYSIKTKTSFYTNIYFYCFKPMLKKPEISFFQMPPWINGSSEIKKIIHDLQNEYFEIVYKKGTADINSQINSLKQFIVPYSIPNSCILPYLSPYLCRGLFETIINLDRKDLYKRGYIGSDRMILRKMMDGILPKSILTNVFKSAPYNREILGIKNNYIGITNLMKNSILEEIDIIDRKKFLQNLDAVCYDTYHDVINKEQIAGNLLLTLAHDFFLESIRGRNIAI